MVIVKAPRSDHDYFDPESRLTSVGATLTAGYLGNGLRAWKQTASGRTYFLYDGITPVCELDASGTVTAVNTFGANGLLARHTTGAGAPVAPHSLPTIQEHVENATIEIKEKSKEDAVVVNPPVRSLQSLTPHPLAQTHSVFYTFDPQGSTAQRLDAGGNILSSHFFDAFGNSTTALPDPFGYGAQWSYYADVETGLQLLGFRYYDASAGRFINRDPISYAGGINVYSYVKNKPMNKIDPFGLDDSASGQIDAALAVARSRQQQVEMGISLSTQIHKESGMPSVPTWTSTRPHLVRR